LNCSSFELPLALAGGVKFGNNILMALAKIAFFVAKACFIFIHFSPAKAIARGKSLNQNPPKRTKDPKISIKTPIKVTDTI
jgi:hypothetical protein